MAALNGYNAGPYMGSGATVAPASPSSRLDNGRSVVVDGTPIRVVIIAFAAAASLTALKFAGFRFNVGVSN